MKITKTQLKQIIKEDLTIAMKNLRDYRRYMIKGEWRLRAPGAGSTYLIPGWRTGMPVEDFLGDKSKAKIFDNEVDAEVKRDLIAKDPANRAAGILKVEGEPSEE